MNFWRRSSTIDSLAGPDVIVVSGAGVAFSANSAVLTAKK